MSFHGRVGSFNQGGPHQQQRHVNIKCTQQSFSVSQSGDRVYLQDLQPGPAKNVSTVFADG